MHIKKNCASRWTADAVLLWLFVCCVLAVVLVLGSRGPALNTQDFRCFYAAGQMLRHSRSLLYDLTAQLHWQRVASGGNVLLPFYHPAYETLLYAPLTLLTFKTAYLLYAACNMVLLWVCYLVSCGGSSPFSTSRRPVLLFLSFPLLLAIFVGQNSLLMLLAFTLAYNALASGNDRRAGLILGLAIFKLATVVPLALLLTVRRGRRFAIGFLTTSAACIALSILLTGIHGTRDFFRLIAGATLAADHSIETQRATAVWLHSMPNVEGLLYLCGTGHLSPHTAFALNAAATLLLLAACAWMLRRTVNNSVAFSAAILGAVLVSPHLYIYDFSALILPFLLLSHRWLKYVAILWFLLLPALYAYGFLTWFAPAVVIPLALLALCFAQVRSERDEVSVARQTAPAMAPP